MAYLFQNPKTDIYYIYHQGKCRESLGRVGPREADVRLMSWIRDNGVGKNVKPADKSMEFVWREYMQHLIKNGYSAHTISDAERCVYPFIKTLERLEELTPKCISDWDLTLQNWICQNTKIPKLMSRETRAHRLRTISAFCGWLKDVALVNESPFKVKIPAQRKDAGRALTGAEVHKLFECWPTGEARAKQSYADLAKLFFLIKFYAGTRTTELLGYYDEYTDSVYPGATYENLNRPKCILKLEKTKSGESREIALNKKIIDLIPDGTGPIFYEKICKTALRRYLARACKAAGIMGRFRVHDSRVTAATEWGRKTRDPKSLMNQFGWATEMMALHYTKVATKERVEQAQTINYE